MFGASRSSAGTYERGANPSSAANDVTCWRHAMTRATWGTFGQPGQFGSVRGLVSRTATSCSGFENGTSCRSTVSTMLNIVVTDPSATPSDRTDTDRKTGDFRNVRQPKRTSSLRFSKIMVGSRLVRDDAYQRSRLDSPLVGRTGSGCDANRGARCGINHALFSVLWTETHRPTQTVMSEAQREPDLRPLETKYQILSELRTGSAVRTYMARSRDDGIDVVITVAQGGANNPLAHFASDNQLLSTVSHPAVPRVLDRHWLGEDFAVVRERIRGRSLHELLSADERLTNVQIAAVLQTVHGIMDWARQLGVVHRGVTPKTVFFEEHSERVLVALVPTRMPIEGIPDASADAATIGELAWAMLTWSPREADAEHASERLGELRPDLAAAVRDAVVGMTQHKNGGDAPDIAAFIATIAMADALKQGEIEAARLQAEMVEEVRAEREERERALRAREQKNIEDAE